MDGAKYLSRQWLEDLRLDVFASAVGSEYLLQIHVIDIDVAASGASYPTHSGSHSQRRIDSSGENDWSSIESNADDWREIRSRIEPIANAQSRNLISTLAISPISKCNS